MNRKEHDDGRGLLIILSIACLILIIITTIQDAWLSPLRNAVGYILLPVQSGVNTVGRALYNYVEDQKTLSEALQENENLQERIDELLTENTRLELDTYELNRLRSLLELDEDYGEYDMVGARVIAKDSEGWFKVFRIDKGSAHGIKADMNVMASGGLVGIVTDVGRNYATVRAIIDDVSRVSAMSLQTGDTCIISGDLQLHEEGRLSLTDLSINADIKDGDKIVTSNISSKYVPGLLIGYATDITVDESRLTKSGYLVPVVDFETLQEVLVITQLKEDMTELSSQQGE